MAGDSLASFIEDVCGDSHLRVEADLGGGFVRLRSVEAERRQAAHDIRSTEDIVIEMLRNARDAHASHIFLAVTRDGQARRLVMVDDGDGVPPAMHGRIFEPRVTSKLDTVHMDKWGVHGRGMALYSIAVNAQRAYIAASDAGKGSSFVVETDLARLGEKTDQSTFPTFELGEGGSVAVRGPRNIVRTACEFAIECRDACAVHVGSATDVAAALYAFGLSSVTAEDRVFCRDAEALPVCVRLAACGDPGTFAQCAAALGLEMSERSARRILDGEIAPAPSLLSRIRIEGAPASAPEPAPGAAASKGADGALQRIAADARGLRVADVDLEALSARIAEAFAPLARDYYLVAGVQPEIKVSKDALRISIPLVKMR